MVSSPIVRLASSGQSKGVRVAHWTSRLVGTRPHGRELEWSSPDAERIRSALGDGAVNWAIEVGERIATKITSEIPPLGEGRPHFNALRRATTSTTMRALALTAGLVGSGASLSSVEEVEIAQDFAPAASSSTTCFAQSG